jgi:ubiquitin-conjugating enzyme E2 A
LEGITAEPSPENMLLWTAVIQGPQETPWEGGVFTVELTFPQSYPIEPPSARFKTQVFHPNVYADGRVCVDVLQNKWSPVSDVLSVLVSLQLLLMSPNPASPANPEAGELFTRDPEGYNARVRAFVRASAIAG